MQLVLAALPQPRGVCGVISVLCDKPRDAFLLLSSLRCAFSRLPAVTAFSSLLADGNAAQFPRGWRVHSSS